MAAPDDVKTWPDTAARCCDRPVKGALLPRAARMSRGATQSEARPRSNGTARSDATGLVTCGPEQLAGAVIGDDTPP